MTKFLRSFAPAIFPLAVVALIVMVVFMVREHKKRMGAPEFEVRNVPANDLPSEPFEYRASEAVGLTMMLDNWDQLKESFYSTDADVKTEIEIRLNGRTKRATFEEFERFFNSLPVRVDLANYF